MTNIIDLPHELIYNIIYYVGLSDIKNLIASHRNFNFLELEQYEKHMEKNISYVLTDIATGIILPNVGGHIITRIFNNSTIEWNYNEWDVEYIDIINDHFIADLFSNFNMGKIKINNYTYDLSDKALNKYFNRALFLFASRNFIINKKIKKLIVTNDNKNLYMCNKCYGKRNEKYINNSPHIHEIYKSNGINIGDIINGIWLIKTNKYLCWHELLINVIVEIKYDTMNIITQFNIH